MLTFIKNIRQLINVRTENQLLRGKHLATLPVIDNAFLMIEDERIKLYGAMQELENKVQELGIRNEQLGDGSVKIIDAQAATILPTYCDSHTHIVFAATRETEFVDKIKGLSYAEIAEKVVAFLILPVN